MDCFHHCIPVDSGRSGSSTPAPEPKDDDGMMSTKLYLALCGATNKDAVAIENAMDLLPPDDQLADRVSVERNNVFHLAAEQGHTELIRKLHARLGNVLSGSLLSSPNTAKDTPLHCAARAGHDVAVTVLVKLARDCGEEKTVLWWKNEAGDTALHLAARLGHAKAVQAMVSKAPGLASVLNGAGVSPLYLAVMSKEERAVEAITSSCRDALAAGPNSQNALHAAVFQGKGMVKLLLDWKPCGPSLANEADWKLRRRCHPSRGCPAMRCACTGQGRPLRVGEETAAGIWARFRQRPGAHAGQGRPLRSPRRGGDGPCPRRQGADASVSGRLRAPGRRRRNLPARRREGRPLQGRRACHRQETKAASFPRPPQHAGRGRQHGAPPRGGRANTRSRRGPAEQW